MTRIRNAAGYAILIGLVLCSMALVVRMLQMGWVR